MAKARRHIAVSILAAVTLIVLGTYPAFGPGQGVTGGPVLHAEDLSDPVNNFFILRRYYLSWHEGLFGSRRYHERKLFSLLRSLLGREIITEKDYMLASPEGIYDHRMVSRFENSRWLYIHGDLDTDSVTGIAGSDYAFMKGWWRSGTTVAVRGTVKNFKLDRDARGDIIRIYLDKVKVLYKEE
ncbi:MAG: hypothetical protein E4G96_03660 [Chrysiogenales bacterium]|nr:MAG: hypothetical protein E4G96_03660 [Chrysiogenales bacterium]